MIIMKTPIVLPPAAKLIIAPIGDIHFNAPGHDRERFVDAIRWLAETAKKPDRVVLVPLMGDEFETMSGSERSGYRSAKFHGSTRSWIENQMIRDLDSFVEVTRPIHHLIPSVLSGNHNFTFQESSSGTLVGKSLSRAIAERLGKPALGICGVNVLEMRQSKNGTGTTPFKIFMHHGFGSASTKAASIRQMIGLKEKFPMCDMYIMGHNHVKIGTTTEGIDFRLNSKTGEWRMVEVVQAFVRSASFLKGYVEGEYCDDDTGSYVEQKCLNPAGLGVVTANVRWKEKVDDNGHKRYAGFKVHVQE